ncbi:MAG: hypothetical protein ACOCV2_01480 [Persicimonas sp.]
MTHLQFTSWQPLTRKSVDEHAPRGPAAVQVRVEEGLVDYPSGRSSAMVCYFFASESAHQTLTELFEDELDQPGARGHGPLLFRYIKGEDKPLNHLKKLLHKFHTQFGAMPLFNQVDDG